MTLLALACGITPAAGCAASRDAARGAGACKGPDEDGQRGCRIDARRLQAGGRQLLDLGAPEAAARDLEKATRLAGPDAAAGWQAGVAEAEWRAALAAAGRGDREEVRRALSRARALGRAADPEIDGALLEDEGPGATLALSRIGAIAEELAAGRAEGASRRWFSAYLSRGGREPRVCAAATMAFSAANDWASAERAAACSRDARLECAAGTGPDSRACVEGFAADNAEGSAAALQIAALRGWRWQAAAPAAVVASGCAWSSPLHDESDPVKRERWIADQPESVAPGWADPIARATLARLAGDLDAARAALEAGFDAPPPAGCDPDVYRARRELEGWQLGLLEPGAAGDRAPLGFAETIVHALVRRAELDPVGEWAALQALAREADLAEFLKAVSYYYAHGDLVPAIALCEERLASGSPAWPVSAAREELLADLRRSIGTRLLAGDSGRRRRERWGETLGASRAQAIAAQASAPPDAAELAAARLAAAAELSLTSCPGEDGASEAAPATRALLLLLLRAGRTTEAEQAAARFVAGGAAELCRGPLARDALARGGDIAGALALGRAVMEEAPEDAHGLQAIAAIELAGGRAPAAELDLEAYAFASGDGAGAAMADGARLLESAGAATAACALLNRAVAWSGGTSLPLLRETAACLSDAGRAGEAVPVLRVYLARAPVALRGWPVSILLQAGQTKLAQDAAAGEAREAARLALARGDVSAAGALLVPLVARRPLDEDLLMLDAQWLAAAGRSGDAEQARRRAEVLALPLSDTASVGGLAAMASP